MVAALFVQKNGCYFELPDVDPWSEERDARTYDGPHPVVAHPPCARWSRLAGFCEKRWGLKRRDDGGCFASALASVRRFGGVLEHPAESAAWAAHDLPVPSAHHGWTTSLWNPGEWSCFVEQGHYGHVARKPTWLYAAVGRALPRLKWGPAQGLFREVENLSRQQRIATPPAFRDELLAIARTATRRAA